jgi:hypothetical protein
MDFEIYTFISASLYISRLALAAAAIVLCVLLFGRTRCFGWLLLGVAFIEPLYMVVWRFAVGLPMLWFMSPGIRPGGVPVAAINFNFPTLSIFAVAGLFLLYRKAKNETKSD